MYLIVRDRTIIKETYDREEAHTWAKKLTERLGDVSRVSVFEAKFSAMNLEIAREVRGIK